MTKRNPGAAPIRVRIARREEPAPASFERLRGQLGYVLADVHAPIRRRAAALLESAAAADLKDFIRTSEKTKAVLREALSELCWFLALEEEALAQDEENAAPFADALRTLEILTDNARPTPGLRREESTYELQVVQGYFAISGNVLFHSSDKRKIKATKKKGSKNARLLVSLAINSQRETIRLPLESRPATRSEVNQALGAATGFEVSIEGTGRELSLSKPLRVSGDVIDLAKAYRLRG
tara:strand:- start:530 stop:1246 length:717 start_codon:yes stop_codon:yes gene_type:complete